MDKKAIIKVISNASMEDEERIEVISPGIFRVLEGRYEAEYEETELSGMEGTTTFLKIDENQIILEREGTTTTKMVFNLDEPCISLYNTPYGMLELAITTNDMYIELDENGGELRIEYDMAVAGQEPLSTELKLTIITK